MKILINNVIINLLSREFNKPSASYCNSLDSNDFPVGIFSERDYARKVILKGKNSKNTLLDEVMTKELITVTKDHKIDQCMEIMVEKRIRHLPVLENKKIIGIISIGDLLKITIKDQKELINQLQKFITT